MMRKTLLSLLFFAASLSAMAGAPVQQRLTGVVSVAFPSAPRATHVGDQQNYLYETDTCAWLAQVRPYEEDGHVHDSVTLASFYDGMAKGILRAAKGTEIHRSDIRIGGLRALEIEYIKGESRSLPSTVCSRAIKVNGNIVIASFTAPTQLYNGMTAMRDRFFSSIMLDHDSTLQEYPPYVRVDSAAPAATAPAASAGDSTAVATQAPVAFMDSHAGSVVKMIGLLVMVCALIYGWAVYTRRRR